MHHKFICTVILVTQVLSSFSAEPHASGDGTSRNGRWTNTKNTSVASQSTQLFFKYLFSGGTDRLTVVKKGTRLLIANSTLGHPVGGPGYGNLGLIHVFEGVDANWLYDQISSHAKSDSGTRWLECVKDGAVVHGPVIMTQIDDPPSAKFLENHLSVWHGPDSFLAPDVKRFMKIYNSLPEKGPLDTKKIIMDQVTDPQASYGQPLVAWGRGKDLMLMELKTYNEGVGQFMAKPTLVRILPGEGRKNHVSLWGRLFNHDKKVQEDFRDNKGPPSNWDVTHFGRNDEEALHAIDLLANTDGRNHLHLGDWEPKSVEEWKQIFRDFAAMSDDNTPTRK